MKNGEKARRRAVAVPKGSPWYGHTVIVSAGPYGPGEYFAGDQIGHSSQLDFAMPGDCAGATAWGRREIQVRAA